MRVMAGLRRGGEGDSRPNSEEVKWPPERIRRYLVLTLIPILLFCLIAVCINIGERVAQKPPVPVIPKSAPPPDGQAEAFAVRFATAYLTTQAGEETQWEASIKPYVVPNLNTSNWWAGNGTQTVGQVIPVSETRSDGLQHVLVVAAVGQGWLYLSVPIYQDQTGYSVVGPPALVPAPGQTSTWSAPVTPNSDGQLTSQLESDLSAFFTAYAASNWTQLGYYTAPGTSTGGLAGAATFKSLQLSVLPGGDTRTALASVTWQEGQGGEYVQNYVLQLKQLGGKWLVAGVTPAGGENS
jgi:Conjugative transposon protein TcpC